MMRIVSLAPSNTEILWALGLGDLLVGVTRYCDWPPEARQRAEVVGGFVRVDVDRVLAQRPDLVLLSSDLQHEIARELVRRDATVLALNPVDLEGIYRAIELLAAVAGRPERAVPLISGMRERVERVRARAAALPRRPAVYFEEWPRPLRPGTGWVARFVEEAGGRNVFGVPPAGVRKQRAVVEPEDVVAADPELILAAWCGACDRTNPDRISARPGWARIRAVRDGRVHVLDDRLIIRPGPRVVEGLEWMAERIAETAHAG
jgi:iron complex transport system substrate-binding protein